VVQKIPLKLARQGMILAKPVLRDNGLVLVAEGAEISDVLLARLGKMDIETVVVKGNPVDLEGLAGGTDWAKRDARLPHLFRRWKADPWMSKLQLHLHSFFNLKAAQAAAEAAAEKEAMLAQDEEAAEKGV